MQNFDEFINDLEYNLEFGELGGNDKKENYMMNKMEIGEDIFKKLARHK